MQTENHKPKVLLLSGYDAASHRRWREQLVRLLPEAHWHTLTLSPRFFSWRIRGNALSWFNEPALQQSWDLIIATSMVDLAAIKGTQPALAGTPSLLYMHENQFAFPASEHQKFSAEPQVVNLYSALAADSVVFNSAWNRDSFLKGVEGFLNKMPDAVPEGVIRRLRENACVIPVPIEDRLFVARQAPVNWACPHLLWNHRWEYDKAPERFLALLEELEGRGMAFRVSVVGERFRRYPAAFDAIRERFAHRLVHWGFLEDRAAYDRLLAQADVVVSTALHDFQGLAMLEAMASGCVALAPDRLAYREYVPEAQRYASLEAAIADEACAAADCLQRLAAHTVAPVAPDAWRGSVLASDYARRIQTLTGNAVDFSDRL